MKTACVFASPNYRARELSESQVAEVQKLYEENPDYFLAVHQRRLEPDAAQREFDELPPSHISYTRRWFIGLYDHSEALIGVAVSVSDLAASGVWHIAFYLIATALHGTGAAVEIYAALEAWTLRSGAKWLRLGVVVGHARAERFWKKQGFREVRVRDTQISGETPATVRVLIKPLGTAGLDEYLAAVPRDRPNSMLP